MIENNDKQIVLSKKESQILSLIVSGRTSTQIAETVNLSLPTIKWYRKKLKEIFDAETTSEMVGKAIKAGFY